MDAVGGLGRDRTQPLLGAIVLAAIAVVVLVASRFEVLPLALAAVVAGAALVVVWGRPALLLYAYCAAIPFNFALPPGPGGTVARIVGVAFFVGYLVRRPNALRLGAVPLVAWLFLGWALASGLWAIDAGEAFGEWVSLAQLVLITALVAAIVSADVGTVRPALWSYAIAATFTGVVGITSYVQGPAAFLARAAAFPDQDPALWASLLLPAAVFLMSEAESAATSKPLRLVAAAAFGLCIVALALSGTRSAWLGLAAAMLVWLVVRRGAWQIATIGALVCGLAVAVALVPGVGDFLAGRVDASLVTGGAGRTAIWAVAVTILLANPVLGVGIGNFGLAFSPSAIASTPGVALGGEMYAGRGPHNVLLGTSVEMGVVGGVLLAALAALALAGGARDRTSLVVRVALVALFVQSMFLDIQLQKQIWLFLAMAFGLAAARSSVDGEAGAATGGA